MTPEERELLIKDLCARLPYGVKCYAYQYKIDGNHCECYGTLTGLKGGYFYLSDRVSINGGKTHDERYLEVKPYLRPMSSMTEEERIELKDTTCPKGTGYFDERYLICPMNHFGEHIGYEFMSDILDWLNAHHFDYRGLIEKGLALEAPEGMYKTE